MPMSMPLLRSFIYDLILSLCPTIWLHGEMSISLLPNGQAYASFYQQLCF